MGELMDAWIAQGRKNIWGNSVQLSMLQAENGVAGALHGATATGTISSSFTSAQGLLLMIPDMYKCVQELTPAIIHVASRAVANGGMSIFNDHSDVYACRSSGIPMMCSNNVQEVYDLGAVSHLTTIKMGIPFMHFFDGFRTSHEINTLLELDNEQIRPLVDQEGIYKMRARSMNPEHPTVRGCILGSEHHWLAAEKANPIYAKVPDTVADFMNRWGKITGRHYKPFDYVGHPEAEQVCVLMGSGAGTLEEYIHSNPSKKIGLIKVHLYRPFSLKYLLAALPSTTKRICVLDKVREISCCREPLYSDVASALHNVFPGQIIGGRYGIGSKDFAPNHAEAIYKNLESFHPQDGFTVGLNGGPNELPIGPAFDSLPEGTTQCLFWGLGSDGTVGANKDAIKIIVDNTPLFGQAYFAYDAHKSGGLTMSHVRFGKKPISASYLIQSCDYIACHNALYPQKFDLCDKLKEGGTFVINCPDDVDFDKYFPAKLRKTIADKHAKVYAIDADRIAVEMGMPGRINQIMQTVFFKLANVIPEEQAIKLMKASIAKTYKRKGKEVIEKNWKMVDNSIKGLRQINYDQKKWAALKPVEEPEWKGYKRLLQLTMHNRGDEMTLQQFTDIAAMPPNTSRIEKRGVNLILPVWDHTKCVQCNQCVFVCPHAVIRPFLLTEKEAEGLTTIKAKGKELKGLKFRIQISPYDCTGCQVCSHTCPTKALKMVKSEPHFVPENKNWEQCMAATNKAHLVKPTNVRNVGFIRPLLEFNGACPGCGEPEVIKLITQLYGDQLYLANAAGCSVVWGSSYPWNPYCTNEHGHGPTWAFSLFEDNAEFGFGMYQSCLARRKMAHHLIEKVLKEEKITPALRTALEELLKVWDDERSQAASRKVQAELAKIEEPSETMKDLISQKDELAKKIVWIMGGDGWAYDIGYGGLDHVIASGEDVNIIVLDTEVYSNTGGQCSKATQRGAVANFSAAGYAKAKKDLGAIAMTYKNVYVASCAHLADPEQCVKAIREAGSYKGPSLVINYAPCINHGIKKGLSSTPEHVKDLVKAGYVILYRYDPRRREQGKNPLQIDSAEPDYNIEPLTKAENRFAALKDIYPKEAAKKYPLLVQDLKRRYQYYADLAGKK